MRDELNAFQKSKQPPRGGGEEGAKEKENACQVRRPARRHKQLLSLSCHLQTEGLCAADPAGTEAGAPLALPCVSAPYAKSPGVRSSRR